jgi:hypothetical protein
MVSANGRVAAKCALFQVSAKEARGVLGAAFQSEREEETRD